MDINKIIAKYNDDMSIPVEKRVENIIEVLRWKENYHLVKFLWDLKVNLKEPFTYISLFKVFLYLLNQTKRSFIYKIKNKLINNQ